MSSKKLVIVESPTKAKTIRKFLDKNYIVESCMGHIRDLPQSSKDIPEKLKKQKWAQIGVDYENHFTPLYIIPKDKLKVVKSLKEKLKDASELYLATDEDREGESISWHLQEVLQPKVPIKRMIFNEITQSAIKKSLQDTRSLDLNLVKAQEARRILDRLVGYTISPLLWKKVAYGLSAGRVQSVAVRLIVEREAERMQFSKSQYWGLKAELKKEGSAFEAKLIEWEDQKVASSADFDSKTGEIKKTKNILLLNQAQVQNILEQVKIAPWTVTEVEKRPVQRRPMAPFITSTLQQEASRKLGLTAREAMQVAQKLYEQGFITYMRTDSTFLSEEAIKASRAKILEKYGKEYLPDTARVYDSKKVKGAQEAHEAIRPAGVEFVDPEFTGLEGHQYRLYDLIWKRTMASQMEDSRQTQMSVKIKADKSLFSANGMSIDFPGYLRAYVEGHDDPEAKLEEREVRLPQLKTQDLLQVTTLAPTEHETKPPARFTEASLVQLLEKEGIGRPSTYASIMGTIVDRGYVRREGNTLIPTFTAFVVTQLLKKYLTPFVDVGFTSEMESSLDLVAQGELDSQSYLSKIYLDKKQGLLNLIQEQDKLIEPSQARSVTFSHLPGFEFKVGKYGAYVVFKKSTKANADTDADTDADADANANAVPIETEVSVTIPDQAAPADVTQKQIMEWVENKEKGADSLGVDPESKKAVYLLGGRYGYYVQLGEISNNDKEKPKRVGLAPQMKPTDVTLDVALELLALPKFLGEHPENQKKISVSIGRFGPYVNCDGEFRSVPKDKNFLRLTLPEALELLAQPKGQGRGRRTKTVLRELGEHPKDKAPIQIFNGPYGPYMQWNKLNASLPQGVTPEQLTLEQAVKLLQDKADLGPSTVKKKKSK